MAEKLDAYLNHKDRTTQAAQQDRQALVQELDDFLNFAIDTPHEF